MHFTLPFDVNANSVLPNLVQLHTHTFTKTKYCTFAQNQCLHPKCICCVFIIIQTKPIQHIPRSAAIAEIGSFAF